MVNISKTEILKTSSYHFLSTHIFSSMYLKSPLHTGLGDPMKSSRQRPRLWGQRCDGKGKDPPDPQPHLQRLRNEHAAPLLCPVAGTISPPESPVLYSQEAQRAQHRAHPLGEASPAPLHRGRRERVLPLSGELLPSWVLGRVGRPLEPCPAYQWLPWPLT